MSAPTQVRTEGLEVEGLTVDYGNGTGLWDFTLRVQPGEVVCVIGRNGAGKSSALLGISGFVKPDRGTVRVDGATLSGAPYKRCREQVSLVVKGRSLFGSLTLDVLRLELFLLGSLALDVLRLEFFLFGSLALDMLRLEFFLLGSLPLGGLSA